MLTWTCRTCQMQIPPPRVMGKLGAHADEAIHSTVGTSAGGSTVPIICGPVMLVVEAPTLPELLADWRALVRAFTTVPKPRPEDETIALVNRSMATAFAAIGAPLPASIEEWQQLSDRAWLNSDE